VGGYERLKTGILLSGGMDSLALTWWKRPDVAFTVDYGQAAALAEYHAASAACLELKIEHHLLRVDCGSLGSGDMVLSEPDAHAPNTDWWPYRNQLIVTIAAMKAIALEVEILWLGTVKSDQSHKDGTTEFLRLINNLVEYQEGELRVEAPAISMSTLDLIKMAGIPPHVLAWAHSCHKANVPCNNCRGCNKYRETYERAGNDLDWAR